MKEKYLGNTSVAMPPIGQGIGLYKWDVSHVDVIREGIDLGMCFLDTAENYDDGNSERIIAKAIKGKRDRVIVATKISPDHHRFDDVIWSAERSLQRLEIDCIDLYQVHWPNPVVPLEETLSAFDRLVEAGKVRHVGLGNMFSSADLAFAKSLNKQIVSTQMEYNLFDRTVEKTILPFCHDASLTFIAYSPLDQGRIANGNDKRTILSDMAAKYNLTSAQLALCWLIGHESVIAIPKATKVSHLRENAQCLDVNIAQDDINVIDECFLDRVHYILPREIKIIQGGQGNRQAYETLEQAKANSLGFIPSPMDLAFVLPEKSDMKPVRLKNSEGQHYIYDLVEGRIRYWAWVLAFGWDCPVPALIYRDWFKL